MKLAVGMGCDRGTSLLTLETALDKALLQIHATRNDVSVFASIDKKNDEVALLQLAVNEGKPLQFFSAEELSVVPVPNPSETVRKYMGTPAVSEAAALLASKNELTSKNESAAKIDQHNLLVEKYKYLGTDGKNATVSIARMGT